MVLNIGPQHPSTHGVLRVVVRLDGERVTEAEPVLGYMHRAFEKLAEQRSPMQNTALFNRLDWIQGSATRCRTASPASSSPRSRSRSARRSCASSSSSSTGSRPTPCSAVSTGSSSARSPRRCTATATASTRSTSSRWSPASACTRTSPHRRPQGRLPEGLLRADPAAPRVLPDARRSVARLPHRQRRLHRTDARYRRAPAGRRPRLRRVRTEPSGLRRVDRRPQGESTSATTTTSSISLSASAATASTATSSASARSGSRAISSSRRWTPPVRARSTPGRTRMFKVPAGEVYIRAEGPRGEIGYYLISNGGREPYRLKIRTGSFSNVSMLPELLKGTYLPDIVAILGSLDFVVGDIDR